MTSPAQFQVIYECRFWKGDSKFAFTFKWYYLSVFTGLKVSKWLWFLNWERKLADFGTKWPPKRQNWEKILSWQALRCSNPRLLNTVRGIISIPLASAGTQEKKGGRNIQEILISLIYGATPAIANFKHTLHLIGGRSKTFAMSSYQVQWFDAMMSWIYHAPTAYRMYSAAGWAKQSRRWKGRVPFYWPPNMNQMWLKLTEISRSEIVWTKNT